MAKINFKRGEFITHINIPHSFAIYGGERLESVPEDGNKKYYSLICYYNPHQSSKNQFGNWTISSVFDVEIDGNQCLYSLSDGDAAWWRRMNESEKNDALQLLADRKHLAYNPQTMSFRHLAQGENISFTPPTKNQTTTGVHSFGGVNVRNFGKSHRNSRTVNRTEGVSSVGLTVTRVTPEDYTQTKKIKGFDKRMSKCLVAAAKAENKKTASTRNVFYGPYGGFSGIDYGNDYYGGCLPFDYDYYD